MLHIVYLSLGSNLGEKVRNCQRGIGLLEDTEGIEVIAQSPFYRTQPVDYQKQDWFINAALKIETALMPLNLLNCLKTIEKKVGTKPKEMRFGPRILDLDIIFYDDLIMESSELTIPHQRMHKRCFVLKPLCDIDPDVIHPIFQQSLSELLTGIKDDDQAIWRYE